MKIGIDLYIDNKLDYKDVIDKVVSFYKDWGITVEIPKVTLISIEPDISLYDAKEIIRDKYYDANYFNPLVLDATINISVLLYYSDNTEFGYGVSTRTDSGGYCVCNFKFGSVFKENLVPLVAHEIGHLLGCHHSESGVMCPTDISFAFSRDVLFFSGQSLKEMADYMYDNFKVPKFTVNGFYYYPTYRDFGEFYEFFLSGANSCMDKILVRSTPYDSIGEVNLLDYIEKYDKTCDMVRFDYYRPESVLVGRYVYQAVTADGVLSQPICLEVVV